MLREIEKEFYSFKAVYCRSILESQTREWCGNFPVITEKLRANPNLSHPIIGSAALALLGNGELECEKAVIGCWPDVACDWGTASAARTN